MDYFFFILTDGDCICRTCNASQSQDGGFPEDLFAVCPETWVARETANFVTFFFQKYGKNTQYLPSATWPLL